MKPNRFIKKIQEMEALMHKYSEFGAEDTEPSVVLAYAIQSFFEGDREKREKLWPKSASDWQLFTRMDGVEDAANKLSLKLFEVLSADVTFIEVAEAFRYYGWDAHIRRI